MQDKDYYQIAEALNNRRKAHKELGMNGNVEPLYYMGFELDEVINELVKVFNRHDSFFSETGFRTMIEDKDAS